MNPRYLRPAPFLPIRLLPRLAARPVSFIARVQLSVTECYERTAGNKNLQCCGGVASGYEWPVAESKTKILVVDDDARLRDYLNCYLDEQGFAVRPVYDAVEMNRKVAHERDDLMILDLMLPGEDGLSICRRIHGSDEYPSSG